MNVINCVKNVWYCFGPWGDDIDECGDWPEAGEKPPPAVASAASLTLKLPMSDALSSQVTCCNCDAILSATSNLKNGIPGGRVEIVSGSLLRVATLKNKLLWEVFSRLSCQLGEILCISLVKVLGFRSDSGRSGTNLASVSATLVPMPITEPCLRSLSMSLSHESGSLEEVEPLQDLQNDFQQIINSVLWNQCDQMLEWK